MGVRTKRIWRHLLTVALACLLLTGVRHTIAQSEPTAGVAGAGPFFHSSGQAAALSAEPAAPDDDDELLDLPAEVSIPFYRPGPFPFHDGQSLRYRVSWLGIPAADATIRVRSERVHPELWTVEAWLSSNRLVDIFYRMRDHLSEQFGRKGFTPRSMHSTTRENRRFNEYNVTFGRGRPLVTSVRRHGSHLTTHRYRYRAGSGWGPASGCTMALSQPLGVGHVYTFDVFGGANRYVLSFKVEAREKIRTSLGDLDALRIVPSVVYVSDDRMRAKASSVTLWVSAEQCHLPLKMEAAAFIGHLDIDLVAVDESGGSSPGLSAPGFLCARAARQP